MLFRSLHRSALIPMRDQGTAMELWNRKQSGGGLENARDWLQSFGATTLEGRHVVETEDGVRLQFQGKESVWHDHLVTDPRLAKMLLERKKKAGTDGRLFGTDYNKVARFTGQLDGSKYSPKDFRTKRANELAADAIRAYGKPPANEDERKARIKEVAEKVSGVLGNLPSQALSSYVAPMVWSVWNVS